MCSRLSRNRYNPVGVGLWHLFNTPALLRFRLLPSCDLSFRFTTFFYATRVSLFVSFVVEIWISNRSHWWSPRNKYSKNSYPWFSSRHLCFIDFYLHNDQDMWDIWRVDISAKALFQYLTSFDFTAPNATVISSCVNLAVWLSDSTGYIESNHAPTPIKKET